MTQQKQMPVSNAKNTTTPREQVSTFLIFLGMFMMLIGVVVYLTRNSNADHAKPVIASENINPDSPVRLIRLASRNGSVSYVNANNITMFFKDGDGTKVLFTSGKDFTSSNKVEQVAAMLDNPSETHLVP